MTGAPARKPDLMIRGIALMIVAMLVLSCADVIAKIMTSSVPPIEVIWLRFFVFVPITIVAVALSGEWTKLKSQRPVLQVLRSLGMLGSSIFFTTGLAFLPLAEATAMYFVLPLMVAALSILLLGEVVGLRRWVSMGCGLVGVLVIIRPGTGTFDPASVFPILSAASAAFGYVLTRKIGTSDTPLVCLIYSGVVGLIATSAVMPFVWVAPGWEEIGLGIVAGLLYTVVQWLYVLAFRNVSATAIAPFSYTLLIWSGLLGFLVFENIPDQWTLLGSAIIVGSGLYIVHREQLETSEQLEESQGA
jgi:drug/metabolite transporter (DMT)-like permease